MAVKFFQLEVAFRLLGVMGYASECFGYWLGFGGV